MRGAILNTERETDRQTWRHWLSPFATALTDSASQRTVWTCLTNSLYPLDRAVFIHKYYSRVIDMYYIYAIIHYKYKPLHRIFVLCLSPAFVMIRGIGYWTLEWESNGWSIYCASSRRFCIIKNGRLHSEKKEASHGISHSWRTDWHKNRKNIRKNCVEHNWGTDWADGKRAGCFIVLRTYITIRSTKASNPSSTWALLLLSQIRKLKG